MNSADLTRIESQRQALLGQLRTAEAAVRASLHAHGFAIVAREHLERAHSHLQEAYIAINEARTVRTVPQLVDDLNRIQQAMNAARQHKSTHI